MATFDLFPTFLELLGETDVPGDLAGEGFLGFLKGQAPATELTLYWHYPRYHVRSGVVPAGPFARDATS